MESGVCSLWSIMQMSCVTQARPCAPSALLEPSCFTMNKHHLSYSTTLIAYVKHKGACISKLYNETWGLQSNKVARRGRKRILSKFHDRARRSQISRSHHQPKWILGWPLEFFFDEAGGDIGWIWEWPRRSWNFYTRCASPSRATLFDWRPHASLQNF